MAPNAPANYGHGSFDGLAVVWKCILRGWALDDGTLETTCGKLGWHRFNMGKL